MLGLYFHIPFCEKKCPYCAFYSACGEKSEISDYISALVRNILSYKGQNLAADTVYFGGGTPSLLSPEQVSAVLSAVRSSFLLAENAEITLEANPNSVTAESLRGYKMAGVNRISFGVQSANASELELLGRLHSFEDAQKAVKNAQNAGFTNISCDLMLGLPNQKIADATASCRALAGLGIQHISAYILKVEDGTPFDRPEITSALPDDDAVADIYLAVCRELGALGFPRYEISNFAQPEFESRHNLKYWQGKEYLGFGASAHSLFLGKRFFVPNNRRAFIEAPLQPTEIEDENPDALEEYVMLGLRTNKGISLEKAAKLGANKEEMQKIAQFFVQKGLLMQVGDVIALTDNGALVSNGIILELLD